MIPYPEHIRITTKSGTTSASGVYTSIETIILERNCDVQALKDEIGYDKDKLGLLSYKAVYRVFLAGLDPVIVFWDETFDLVKNVRAGMACEITRSDNGKIYGEVVSVDDTDATLLIGIR